MCAPTSCANDAMRKPAAGVCLGGQSIGEVNGFAQIPHHVQLHLHPVRRAQLPGQAIRVQNHVVLQSRARATTLDRVTETLERQAMGMAGYVCPIHMLSRVFGVFHGIGQVHYRVVDGTKQGRDLQ